MRKMYYKAMVYLSSYVEDDRNQERPVSGIPFLETQIAEHEENIKSYVDILLKSGIIKAYRIVYSLDKESWLIPAMLNILKKVLQ